ncbi:MAG TPA: tetratricopeptide repeat protein [Steroidobacteraceae bacterium]|jgi:tetratricopeptide (TPR) repeat protein
MRRNLICCVALFFAGAQAVQAQGYPNNPTGPGSVPGITGSGARGQQSDVVPSAPAEVKPDKAAAKAYAAGTKTMTKVHELEDLVAKSTDRDKKANAQYKLDDNYGKALDQFTEVLRNKNDMYDAWSQVGYVHFRLGAFREAVDDYNHALALKPDLIEAIAYRGEAYLGVDRLDDAKAAYMDLFFHSRPLADQMMVLMQAWLQNHRVAANGVRPGDIDAFDKWLQERDGIAKATASTTN